MNYGFQQRELHKKTLHVLFCSVAQSLCFLTSRKNSVSFQENMTTKTIILKLLPNKAMLNSFFNAVKKNLFLTNCFSSKRNILVYTF